MTDRRSDHRAALRDCRWSIAAILFALFMLYVGIFEVDTTPHLGPDYPKSIGLTLGAGIALVVQMIAFVYRYRQHRSIARHRRLD